jgi:UDP-N-acetylmuramoylalanine--D-glutamate ligase
MQALFEAHGIDFEGPFETLEEAVRRAAGGAGPGTSVLFSPGCASFELFLNEFDRGRTFKRLVAELAG